VLISTAGHRSFLRKTGIISGAYFYCWRHKFSQENISLGYIHYIFHLLFFSLKRYIFTTGEKEITKHSMEGNEKELAMVKGLLRSVLMSSKEGVPAHVLQSK
jgi:hypothetical protein